ncbi:MAG: hypothetical protein ACR2LS_08080 [Thermomicrobiales bacterium]
MSYLAPVALRCEYAERPLGLDSATPRLSWQCQSDRRAAIQSAYRVRVATDPSLLDADRLQPMGPPAPPIPASTRVALNPWQQAPSAPPPVPAPPPSKIQPPPRQIDPLANTPEDRRRAYFRLASNANEVYLPPADRPTQIPPPPSKDSTPPQSYAYD